MTKEKRSPENETGREGREAAQRKQRGERSRPEKGERGEKRRVSWTLGPIDWPLMTRRGPTLISRLKKMAISASQLVGPRPLLFWR